MPDGQYPNRHLMGERNDRLKSLETPEETAARLRAVGVMQALENRYAVRASHSETPRPNTPTPGSDKWIAVDLDGTLAEGVWTPENPVDTIGAPIQHGLNQCARYSSVGWKIVIHTSRPWYHYEMIEEWLEKHGVPFRRIVCGKLFAFRYCDDRGVNASAADWV